MKSVKFHIEGNKIIFDEVVIMESGDTMSFIDERIDETGSLKIDDIVVGEAAQPKMHPTLLEERKIDVYCPHCGGKFGIGLPESQSG